MEQFEIKDRYSVEDFVLLMRRLRAPGGCPWDAEQTHESLRNNVIEEACEVAEAIDNGNNCALREELGDLLMQVIFHCSIEEDKGGFGLDDIADAACKKLVFRHPHVFGEAEGDALEIWEKAKREEKGQRTTAEAMHAVAKTLPALWRAQKIQKKAAGAGFVWPDVNSAVDKIAEETEELRNGIAKGDIANIEEELGDLLLAAVNTAGYFNIDPENALGKACDKYIGRFEIMEKAAENDGRVFSSLSIDEMISYYKRAKKV
ncbi:MAG: nucleoside triphosphate pyrophosphohydrolase [Oscillospiraceae bacterium]|nr:nucleoside triphosphate pyrophosphohydrolase [Oscillospiraceae bacterium]